MGYPTYVSSSKSIRKNVLSPSSASFFDSSRSTIGQNRLKEEDRKPSIFISLDLLQFHATANTYLNADKYLPKLNDKQATALLDTIIHESVHWWLPWGDERQEDSCGKGYPYDEAKRRMTKELIKKYLKMRK